MKAKNDDNLNIYRLLRIARDKKVKDIAEKLNVTSAYINAIESGDRKPSKKLLKDYAQALDVKEETILYFHHISKKEMKFEHFMLKILQIICKVDNGTLN